eukprot:SAG22_NODE_8678_length_637_cov_1.050186_1_plen_110_part_01
MIADDERDADLERIANYERAQGAIATGSMAGALREAASGEPGSVDGHTSRGEDCDEPQTDRPGTPPAGAVRQWREGTTFGQPGVPRVPDGACEPPVDASGCADGTGEDGT